MHTVCVLGVDLQVSMEDDVVLGVVVVIGVVRKYVIVWACAVHLRFM